MNASWTLSTTGMAEGFASLLEMTSDEQSATQSTLEMVRRRTSIATWTGIIFDSHSAAQASCLSTRNPHSVRVDHDRPKAHLARD